MTTRATPKRVWILGAGFSRSLGGPLMTDLLSLAARRRTLAAYRDHISRDEADLVFWLYHYGAGFPEGQFDREADIRGETRWRDAEEFLEILDSAQTDPAKRSVIEDVFESLGNALPYDATRVVHRYPAVFGGQELPQAAELANIATRVVAASCCTFLEGVDEAKARRMERWLPYQQWLGLLRSNDSILTFNYDRVVELLEPSVGPRRSNHSRWGVCVHGVKPDGDELDEARLAELPVLYKLHGSVNWRVEPDGVKDRKDWSPTCLGRDCRVAIATPGDNKMRMAGGAFRKLWAAAAETLHDAHEVFILGFRFPPSDAFPRDRLLEALGANTRDDLRVNVILGPDQNADLRRVLSLLSWTTNARPTFDTTERLPQRQLVAHSFWAEDFLAVWARNEQRRSGLPMPWVDNA